MSALIFILVRNIRVVTSPSDIKYLAANSETVNCRLK